MSVFAKAVRHYIPTIQGNDDVTPPKTSNKVPPPVVKQNGKPITTAESAKHAPPRSVGVELVRKNDTVRRTKVTEIELRVDRAERRFMHAIYDYPGDSRPVNYSEVELFALVPIRVSFKTKLVKGEKFKTIDYHLAAASDKTPRWPPEAD